METILVPGRVCGTCSICCVSLTINDPDLRKVQGVRCGNLTGDGCGIYPNRPKTCAGFDCGWRRLPWVQEALRPDLSGVLLDMGFTGDDRRSRVVSVILLNRAALEADGLAETIVAALETGLPIELVVPGPPGHTSGWARVEAPLRDVLAGEGLPGVRRLLSEAWALLVSGDHQPVLFNA